MPRPPAFVLWIATLASGVALGLTLSRFHTPLAAQSPPINSTPPKPSGVVRGDEDALYADLKRTYDQFESIDRTFQTVARVVSPAVVHITAKKVGEREDGHVGQFEETGSGVIVNPPGSKGLFVLTNNHVVEGANPADVSILLHDGQTLKPVQFWADTKADVAVIKLDREGLPTARLGDSDDARVGTWVMALGSPFGLTQSVSQGIISARGRYEQELEMDGVEHQEFLQTDAAINPGNSGGPLVNMKGEVIGLNTAIASEGGGSEGVGFSIPINLAKWAMTQLVAGGKVYRGAMGVNLQSLTQAKAAELGLERPRGARVALVHEKSPAAQGGLTVGDVVLKFNGVAVIDDNHLINLVSISPIGKPADVIIWRDKKPENLKIVIADREQVLAATNTKKPALNPPNHSAPAPATSPITLSPIDDATRVRYFGTRPTKVGVLIAALDPNGPLAKTFAIGDVIELIGGKPAISPQDTLAAILQAGERNPIDVVFRRMNRGVIVKKSVRLP